MSCFPRTSLKKFPRPIWCQRQNGGIWVFSRVKDGYITWSINPVCVFARMSKTRYATLPSLLLLLLIFMFMTSFHYRTTYLALPTSSGSIPVTPEPQIKGIVKTGHNLKMSERCRVHPRSAGVNIICAAACVFTILWVRLSSLCLISALTER